MAPAPLGENLLDLLADLVFGEETGEVGASAYRPSAYPGPDTAERARALAMADIVVLSAFYDFTVTEAERLALATRVRQLFGRMKVPVTVDELLERWDEPRRALRSEHAFLAAIRSLADDLGEDDRLKTFDSVAVVLTAQQAREASPEAPFRDARLNPQQHGIAVFGEALGASAEAIDAARARIDASADQD